MVEYGVSDMLEWCSGYMSSLTSWIVVRRRPNQVADIKEKKIIMPKIEFPFQANHLENTDDTEKDEYFDISRKLRGRIKWIW